MVREPRLLRLKCQLRAIGGSEPLTEQGNNGPHLTGHPRARIFQKFPIRGESITRAELSPFIARPPEEFFRADYPCTSRHALMTSTLIVHAVKDSTRAYFFHRERNALEPLGGIRRSRIARGWRQQLPSDACVEVFFLADLKTPRATRNVLRAVPVEAGLIGGKMDWLHMRNPGATGLNVFDDDCYSFRLSDSKSCHLPLSIGNASEAESL